MTWAVRRVGIPEYTIYRTWFEDAELSRRLSITPTWFDYVTQTAGVDAWIIFRKQVPAAVVQFGEQPRPAIAIAMNPLLRGQGLCISVIRLTLDQPELRHLDAIYAFIEPDNLASLRCAEKAGFSRVSDVPDADGMFEVVFTRLSQ